MNEVANQQYRDKVSGIVDDVVKHLIPVEVSDLKVKHYFAHGTYTREMAIPKGIVVVGKIHRYSCINIVSKGFIIGITDEGKFRMLAPYTFVSNPGIQKAVYAVTDSIYITVHPWSGEEDLEKIEEYVIAPSYEALEEEIADKKALENKDDGGGL